MDDVVVIDGSTTFDPEIEIKYLPILATSSPAPSFFSFPYSNAELRDTRAKIFKGGLLKERDC